MLILIIGARGSGKTLFASYIASKSKRDIYANYRLNLPKFKPLEVIDLLDLPNDVDVIIDEGYTWLESRISGSHLNRYLSYIVFQIRKRLIDVYVTAQMFSSIDVRFREQSDVIVKCERYGEAFHYSIYWLDSDVQRRFELSYEDAKKYFEVYDTYEIIEPYTKELLEKKILDNVPENRYKRIEKIGKGIKGEFDEIEVTHANVKFVLLKKGFDLSDEGLIYVYLKNNP